MSFEFETYDYWHFEIKGGIKLEICDLLNGVLSRLGSLASLVHQLTSLLLRTTKQSLNVIYIHTYLHTHTHTYIYTYIHVRVHPCILRKWYLYESWEIAHFDLALGLASFHFCALRVVHGSCFEIGTIEMCWIQTDCFDEKLQRGDGIYIWHVNARFPLISPYFLGVWIGRSCVWEGKLTLGIISCGFYFIIGLQWVFKLNGISLLPLFSDT